MRKQNINYHEGLPIKFSLLNIGNYPLHWHDSIEILFVLKGSINIQIGVDSYSISKNQIEIVNHNEIHSISSKEENLVLVLNIDPDFFEKYYEGGREIFYYADSSNKKIQTQEKYKKLRNYIMLLYYEVIRNYEDSNYFIDKILLELMYHLLNNFHYLFYEEESLREDEFELERYHRIVNYIKKNYMNKISLQEIASKEYLSSQYLSYKIKNTFGYSFIDFLNLIRVEQSVKLLLDTDKTLSEISQEVGFSHIRYYNKHFKIHFNMLPREYRKNYKICQKDFIKKIKLEKLDLSLALEYFKSYLSQYTRYDYDDRIEKYEVDLSKELVDKMVDLNTFTMSAYLDFLYIEDKSIIKDLSTELGFSQVILEDVDKLVEKGKQYNWLGLIKIINFLVELDLKIIIFIDSYSLDFKDLEKFLIKIGQKSLLEKIVFTHSKEFLGKDRLILQEKDPINDTLLSIEKLIKLIIYEKKQPIPKLIDNENSQIFTGDTGLYTINNLKKPSYYLFKFLSLMGKDIIYLNKDHIITESKDGYEILLFHPSKNNNKKYENQKKRFSLNILGLREEYTVVKYDLNKDRGSIYDKWIYLEKPESLNREYLKLFQTTVIPDIKFSCTEKTNIFNITPKVKDKGVILYKFSKKIN